MIALLYDVHGNLPALEAVLADAGEGVEYVIGGDVALFGAFPAETVERLRGLPRARWLRGNGERWTADPADATGTELVNPGSVGMPLDGDPRAAYALLHPEGRIEHRRVAYDHTAVAAALRERHDAPWAQIVARRVELARFDV